MQNINRTFVLKDSSVFSELDTIHELEITGSTIKDISGFLKMDSLSKITISQDSMTEVQISEMKNAGIQVIIS